MRSTDDDPPSLSNSLREGEGARGREGGRGADGKEGTDGMGGGEEGGR